MHLLLLQPLLISTLINSIRYTSGLPGTTLSQEMQPICLESKQYNVPIQTKVTRLPSGDVMRFRIPRDLALCNASVTNALVHSCAVHRVRLSLSCSSYRHVRSPFVSTACMTVRGIKKSRNLTSHTGRALTS